MTYKVRFHPKVAADLQTIAQTIAGHLGTAEATRKILQIQETAIGLAHNPKEGSAQSEMSDAIRIAPTGRRGAVVFEMDSDTRTVSVLAVAYGGTAWIS